MRYPYLYLLACLSCTVLLSPVKASIEPERPILWLETGAWPLSNYPKEARLPLLREIFRQSLLVSAELELGWQTYDQSLNEVMPTGRDGPNLELSFSLIEANAFTYRIKHSNSSKHLDGRIPTKRGKVKLYKDGLVQAEALSKTEFHAFLSDLSSGAYDQEDRLSELDKADLPETDELNFLTLWQNLRALHSLLELHGESPELLSALSQTYATQGMVTYSLNSTAPKAFLARGLVYAQRMVAQNSESSEAYYTRAYAFALSGLQSFAIEDITTAKRLGGTEPEWLPVIETYLNYDLDTLENMMREDGFNAQLSGMLAVYAAHPIANQSLLFRFAEPAIKANPKNFQLIHLACEQGGVSTLHRLTRLGPESLNDIIFNDLTQIPELQPITEKTIQTPLGQGRDLSKWDLLISIYKPDHLESVLNSRPRPRSIDYPEMYNALVELQHSGQDDQKPSTATLADLIRETQFVNVMNRLSFMRYNWGVSVDETVESALLELKGHRYEALIKAFSATKNVQEIVAEMEMGEPLGSFQDYLHHRHVAYAEPNFKDFDRLNANKESNNTFDITAIDLEPHAHAKYAMKVLPEVSPNSIAMIKQRILYDKKLKPDQLASKFKDKLHISPMIPFALGVRYHNVSDFQQAKKYYAMAAKSTADPDILQNLASIYKLLSELDDWLKTEKAILELPDYGLTHSFTNDRIAKGLIEQGKWDEALPYALEGAQSYAAIPLVTAAWTLGVTGQVDKGLEYIAASAERYESGAKLAAYLAAFDIEPTRAVSRTLDAAYEVGIKGMLHQQFDAANIKYYQGDFKTAVSLLRGALNESNDAWYGLYAALIADGNAWQFERDALLSRTLELFPKYDSKEHNKYHAYQLPQIKAYRRLLDLYIKINAAGQISPEHYEQLLECIEESHTGDQFLSIHLFVAEIFRIHKYDTKAIELFSTCITLNTHSYDVMTLAYLGLRELDEDPIEIIRNRLD